MRLVALALCLALPAQAQLGDSVADQIANRLAQLRASGLGARPGGVLGLMGYNVTPDGSTNALEINRGSTAPSGSASVLTLGQFGTGFTVSESFPLFVEGYIGYARYDPRAVFTGGESVTRVPFRWNNLTTTIGVGYDIRLAENLYLRPILNGALGVASSDLALFGAFVNYRRDVNFNTLTNRNATMWGIGGSMVLAYYDYTPARHIDMELRFTNIHLQTFSNSLPATRGQSDARTLGLWTRVRWPTGYEAFGRPVRWVVEAAGSYYLGDQRAALGFAWSAKIGGGIEFDIGRHEIGAMGLNVNRVRLIGRYFFGDGGVTGTSFGVGVSF